VKPLKGVTVLDISRLLPGGFASLLLGDLGARIIKVEQPGVGDYYRAILKGSPLLGDQADIINQGKESLTLDLKNPEGRGIFLKLVRKADVVLENFRPGVLKKLSLDYLRLKKINPRVILCSVTGLGQKGPDASLAGHDLNYLGLSGLLSRNRDAGGRMVIPDFQVIDLAAGYDAAFKIAAALHQRTRSKKGAWIDVSMVGTGISMARLYSGDTFKKPSPVAGGLIRYGVYETADARHVTLGALEPKFWLNFCEAIGRKDWRRAAEGYEFLGEGARSELREIFRGKTLQEWVAIGRRHDVCLFPVEDVPSKKEAVRRPTPKVGQQTRQILKGLGYGAREIERLKKQGVIE